MKTILVVDDTLMFRTIMKRNLTKLGFNVIELDSGKNAATVVSSHHLEAIILDLVMDEQEGIETITQLKQLLSCPHIIAVSSHRDYLDCALILGADVAMVKPISPDDLKRTLSRLNIVA